MSLFAELRRRNVIRVGAAYAVIAWVILQVTDLAAPALRLPEWVLSLVLFLLLLGFPIALFLAWAYELTPDGLRRAEDATDATSQAPGGKFDVAIIALLVIAIGLIVHENFFSGGEEISSSVSETVPEEAPGAAAKTVSIAVIPFINMSDDTEQEYFADGLTEELLNSLAPIEELRVVSRTSSFAFKNSDLPLPEIAQRLDVEHILEGSVRRAGKRIRITAQLIDTSSDSHLWSETYDEELTVENIFEVQERIARTVIDALQLRLLPLAPDQAMPANLEALDLYYDGLYVFRQITTGQSYSAASFREAEASFKAASAADPEWLAPVAMLGKLYHFWSAGGQDQEKLTQSRHLIEKVLAQDPDNKNGLGSLGYILWAEGRFDESLEAYEKATEAGAESSWGQAIALLSLGRFDDSVTAYRLALIADPVSKSIRGQLAQAMLCAGMHEGILANEDELRELFPNDPMMMALLARSHARLGNRTEVLAYVEMMRENIDTEALAAVELALIGEEARAADAIRELKTRDRSLGIAAVAALILGEEDAGIDLLERHMEHTPPGFTMDLFCAPEVRSLGGNPRYDKLLESRGLL